MPLGNSLHPRQMVYYIGLFFFIELQLYCDHRWFLESEQFLFGHIRIHHKLLRVESIW